MAPLWEHGLTYFYNIQALLGTSGLLLPLPLGYSRFAPSSAHRTDLALLPSSAQVSRRAFALNNRILVCSTLSVMAPGVS